MQETTLDGRVAIVTGGNSGIGEAVCHALGRAGMKVTVAARRLDRCQAVAEAIAADGGAALAVGVDVRDDAEVAEMVRRTVEHFGALDVLVNNAGLARGWGLSRTTPEDWRTVIDVNLTGTFLCSREAWLVMKDRGRGHIVNIASQDWPEVLGRIRAAGKLCQIFTDPAGALKIVRNHGGKGFMFGLGGTEGWADEQIADFQKQLEKEGRRG